MAKAENQLTTPLGLFNFAESYCLSARALSRMRVRATHRASPIFFLYFHAIELYLKSYLRLQGHTAKELRNKFGHKICCLYDLALGHGLGMEDEDGQVISLLCTTTIVIDARYIRTGLFTTPTFEALDRACLSLRQSVGESLRAKGLPVQLLPVGDFRRSR